MVTPLSSIRYPSSFASQLSSFRGGVEEGNSFGVGVRGGVGGGGKGGVSSEIFQAMQMDQSSLYASQRFGGGGGSSVVGVLGGRGQMRPRRRGCWWIGKQRQGTSSFSYRPRLTVRGQHDHMLLHVFPNRGDGVFSCWRRLTILVAAHSAGGGGGGKKGSWRKL